ncbi:MAG TPA: AmmeMemoRadiSam system protein B [Steroidobacteraceae bacterium]|nr:AmmeMemoRadiSam system protein B [Steroidobacteraceae bacterium]
MAAVRPAAVAGLFYPQSPAALAAQLRSWLTSATPDRATAGRTKAVIVPHAGYVYSGAIAATAYRRLGEAHADIERVVLLAPAHRVAVAGLALPSVDAFETPLGAVELDRPALAAALTLGPVTENDDAHALEHSLEVQLPFLQSLLPRFRLVPFAVGDASPAEVAQVLELLWGGPETLIVVSSDLSHYHRYEEARAIDSSSARTVLSLSPTLTYRQACGAMPINGLLTVAAHRAMEAEMLDLRNSGDTAGDRARVVGYGAFAFTEARG